MPSKLTDSDLNKIKNELQDKIYAEAYRNGHYKIAQIIKDSIHRLDKNYIEFAESKDVTRHSSDVKDRATVFLFIQTKFPDWFDIDRKILLNKIDNKIKICASFSEARYPIDEKMNEFIRLGIESELVPGLPSINISNEEVTFFYIRNPYSEDSKSRIAITIKGKIGKVLASQLQPYYFNALKESSDKKVLPSVENIMRNAIEKILQNRDEIDAIHNLIYETDLNLLERICISIFLLQLDRESNEYVLLSEIEKDTNLEEREILKEIGKIKSLFKFEPKVGRQKAKIKFEELGKSKWMPRLLFDIINTKCWANRRIREIRTKYNLFYSEFIHKREPSGVRRV